MESLQGGTLFNWESGEIVRRIDDVEAKNVGCLQSLSPYLTFFLSRFSGLVPVRYSGHLKTLSIPSICLQRKSRSADDEGFEEAFEVVAEASEGVSLNHFYHLVTNIEPSVNTAKWVGDCFLYTTPACYAATLLVASPTPSVPSVRKASFFISSKTIV